MAHEERDCVSCENGAIRPAQSIVAPGQIIIGFACVTVPVDITAARCFVVVISILPIYTIHTLRSYNCHYRYTPSPRLTRHAHISKLLYETKDMSSQKSTKRPSLNPSGGNPQSKASKMTTTTTGSTSPRPSKRRRTASLEGDLLTPPQQDEDPLDTSTKTAPCYESDDDNEDIFSYASHVLATEAAALVSITTLYRTSAIAKQNLKAAVRTIVQTQHDRGKLIVTGVGKSAYIGQKLVATCKSMGVAASFMHACEAAHGDLGDVRDVSLRPLPDFS